MVKHYSSHCYIFSYLCDYLNSKEWIFRGQRHAFFQAFLYILFNYPSKEGFNSHSNNCSRGPVSTYIHHQWVFLFEILTNVIGEKVYPTVTIICIFLNYQ